MWSFGCIVAECFTNSVTFPGLDTVTQFVRIFERLGTPPAAFVAAVPTEAVRDFVRAQGEGRRQAVREYVPGASAEALDLMEQLFVYEPTRRPTAEEVRHPARSTGVRWSFLFLFHIFSSQSLA